jgi:hypothetical protein
LSTAAADPGVHRLVTAALKVSDLPGGRMQVRQLAGNRVSRGHGGKVNPADGWAYQVVVRLTSWIPSLAMYWAVRTPVPSMT